MRVNEKKIINIIEQLRLDNSNKSNWRKLIEELSIMIYNYPRIVFNASEDYCSEFYIYVIERLQNFILKYNVKKSSFNTWFNIVLKSHYLNWVKINNKGNNFNIISFDYKPYASSDMDLLNIISYQQWKKEEYKDIEKTVDRAIESLAVTDKVIIKLLYFTVDTELLKDISKINKKSVKENFNRYTELLESEEKNIRRINKLKYKLSKARSEMLNRKDDIKYREKILKLRAKYFRAVKNLSIKNISELLELRESEIYSRIRRINRELEERLKYLIKGGGVNET